MMKARNAISVAMPLLTVLVAPAAHAIELDAGDWTFSVSGNVNVHYIYSSCEDDPAAITTVGGACVAGGETEESTSSVSNGLLPAAIVFGAKTTQKGYDISANFGLYPGISTNDGGSPNLQNATLTNTALGTTGLDVRQVYMTFGNDEMGTFMFGRNFGLFGFDAIINDMTIPGVGVAGAASGGTPANTTLGSIGFGYIYTDTLAQMNYSTPNFGGLVVTLGIFDPVEPIFQESATPEAAPGFHGKVAFTSGPLYLSASFLSQSQEGPTDAEDYDSTAIDIGGKFTAGPAEFMAWYYSGSGVGTTGLFVLSDDSNGNERDSDGFIAQATFKVKDTKFGVNYGESNLDYANADDEMEYESLLSTLPSLVKKNSKFTLGVYHSLTPNLTLLAEFSDVTTEAHDGGENKSSNFNVGAFMSF